MSDQNKTETAVSEQNQITVRERIKRGGRIMSRVCRTLRTLLTLGCFMHFALMIAVLFSPAAVEIARETFEDSTLAQTLRPYIEQGGLNESAAAAILCAVMLIADATLTLFAHLGYKMFSRLADGGRPFDLETARRMRKYSWLMLLLTLYNVPLGAISFGIIMLFSYIMEYGSYIQQQADETNRIQEEMIVSLAEITENKSGQTGQHIKRVSEYTRIIAEELGYPEETVESMRLASTMHDLGKILIPSEILEKPGRLTDAEYSTIKTHTTLGGQLLENVEGREMTLSRTIALEHHERVDGKGYPARLSGEEISMEGRIVAVADVYDALTSRRSYKEAWSGEDARREIENGRGTQFDPRVVDAFLAARGRIEEARRKYRD